MSIDTHYLCYGHRLLKYQELTNTTGSWLLLAKDNTHHSARIVEDLKRLRSNDAHESEHRFALIYEHFTFSPKIRSRTVRFESRHTKDSVRVRLHDIFKRHSIHGTISNKRFLPTTYNVWNPDLRSLIGFKNLREKDELWRTHFSSIDRSSGERTAEQVRGKGLHLVQNSRLWHVPYTRSDSAHSLVQGIQWRFVQAFSGFETIILSYFLADPHYDINKPPSFTNMFYTLKFQKRFADIVEREDQKHSRNSIEHYINNWTLQSHEGIQFDDWFIKFVNPNEKGRKVLDDLQTSNTTYNWSRGLSLASALRNLTAHGALSPTQSIAQGLVQIYIELTALLVQCSYAAAFMEIAPSSNKR